MATPKVIEGFIKETRRLTSRTPTSDTNGTHNEIILADSNIIVNLPEPVAGTELFFKFRTDQDVHVIAAPGTTLDGEGQIVSGASDQSMRVMAADATWHKVSTRGGTFNNLSRPSYTLNNFTTPNQAEYGEQISTSVDVLNEGDIGYDPITLEIDGREIDSTRTRLDFNETSNETLSGTVNIVPGNYSISVSTPAANISQAFEVTMPATFISITDLEAPVEVTSGDEVTATVSVSNQGAGSTDNPVELYINDGSQTETLVGSDTVSLDFLESEELTFNFTIDTDQSSVTLRAETLDTEVSRNIQINQ